MGIVMSIIIIESIGFSATHSISNMLRLNGENCVSHGTKNFRLNTRMGIENLSFDEFHHQMIEESSNYLNCISVHSNFSPEDISRTILGTNTKFIGLMRKSQYKQILSCYYWAINGFLNGREDFTQHLIITENRFKKVLRECGLPVNMQSCIMLYAFQHVLVYNLRLCTQAQKILFMEDVLDNPVRAVDLLGIENNSPLSLGVEQGPSHKEKVISFEFLSNAEEILSKISNQITVNIGTSNLTLFEVENLARLKSIFNG